MAKLQTIKSATRKVTKETKRDLLINEVAQLLEETYDQEVKFTKEGIVLEFENEKGDKKDFVFKVIEKKERIANEDFIQ